jgi:hypothetical protein
MCAAASPAQLTHRKNYQEHFWIILQIKIKEFYKLTITPIAGYKNGYNKTYVTASRSAANASSL